eukprot:SAG22_NODE_3605_length_1619_cov_1.309868_1_plen_252_part_00
MEELGLDEYYHLNSAGNDVEALMKAVQREERKRQDAAWRIDPAALTIGALVGKGASGQVHKGLYLGQEVAIKKLRSPDENPMTIGRSALSSTSAGVSFKSEGAVSAVFTGSAGLSDRSHLGSASSSNKKTGTDAMATSAVLKRRKHDFMREARLLITLRHPNIAMIMGAVVNGPTLMIVSEWLVTSVYDYIHSAAVPMDYSMKIAISLDVSRCMEFLHESNPVVLHKDLKAANLLLDSNMVCKWLTSERAP